MIGTRAIFSFTRYEMLAYCATQRKTARRYIARLMKRRTCPACSYHRDGTGRALCQEDSELLLRSLIGLFPAPHVEETAREQQGQDDDTDRQGDVRLVVDAVARLHPDVFALRDCLLEVPGQALAVTSDAVCILRLRLDRQVQREIVLNLVEHALYHLLALGILRAHVRLLALGEEIEGVGVVEPRTRDGDACIAPFHRREHVAALGAEGNAIGGLAVGEPTEVMYDMIDVVNEILPQDRPRYLMGVGTPVNILEAIDRGVDMMDCVMPTRNGRNGMLFTPEGTMNMRNRKWADDFRPIWEDGPTDVDRIYSRAYLRHLFIAEEILAMQIASIHNLAFYLWLVGEARRHIFAGDFHAWKEEMVTRLNRRL